MSHSLYLSKFFILDNSFYTEKVIYFIYIKQALILFTSQCFWNNDIITLIFFYNIVNIIFQDNKHWIYIISRIFIYFKCSLILEFQSSNLFLFFYR